MKVHPRHFTFTKARIEFLKYMLDFEERHDLTTAEKLRILGEYQQHILKYAIKAEREEVEDGIREPNSGGQAPSS